MNRRDFMEFITAGTGALSLTLLLEFPNFAYGNTDPIHVQKGKGELSADVVIAGGGLGGCAAALAILRNNLRVIHTEETDWIGIGGQGCPVLRLRGDLMGIEDGLAKYPYIRESRRIIAEFTVLEEHVGVANRAMVTGKASGNTTAHFYDIVGVGYYHIDLHPSSEGDNYIDFGSLPFQIPLGALLPRRMENMLPANKNIGTTHITNGCYRLHQVEWSIGESVGLLVAFALSKQVIPRVVRENQQMLEDFQRLIRSQGIETHWPV